MISPAPPYITSARLVSQLGGRVGSSTFASHRVVLVWCVLYTYIYVWWLVLYSIIIVYYFWKQLWLSKLRCSDQVIHLCQREECKNGSEQCMCVELEEEEEAMVELQTWVKWRVWGGDLVICWCRRTLVFYEKNLNDHDVLTTTYYFDVPSVSSFLFFFLLNIYLLF